MRLGFPDGAPLEEQNALTVHMFQEIEAQWYTIVREEIEDGSK